MSKRFTYWNSFASAPSSSYILDEITSSASYAVSFSRYLKASYVGSPVVRLRMPSNGNQEFDFTPTQLTDGTATGLSNGGNGVITRIYSHINGTFFFDVMGNRQHSMIVGGVMQTDSFGKPAMPGKLSTFGRYVMSPLPYTGSNCAAFDVSKMSGRDLPDDTIGQTRKTGAIGRWGAYATSNPTYFILGLGYKIRQVLSTIPFTSAFANGNDISGGSNDMLVYNGVETISNMTGVDLTTSSVWTNQSTNQRVEIWPNSYDGSGLTTRRMEQIYFNDFLQAERTIIETNQRNFYGYY